MYMKRNSAPKGKHQQKTSLLIKWIYWWKLYPTENKFKKQMIVIIPVRVRMIPENRRRDRNNMKSPNLFY